MTDIHPETDPDIGTDKLFIKICGLTRREDAELAVVLGASALGFVFYPPSPRAISPQAAGAIITALPEAVWKVGVFVNTGFEEIVAIATTAGLTHVQLHGNEDPALGIRLGEAGFGVIKALRLQRPEDLNLMHPWPTVLIDAPTPEWGGSGQQADWELAARAAAKRPVLLAGGINEDNLEQALASVRPWGIDLSSGVEAAPGIKDAEKLERLFQKARATHHANPD